jgi:predicted ester cyclase
MSVEQNIASMRRGFEEVWNKGNLAVIPEVISPQYVGYSSVSGEISRGLAGYEQMVKSQRTMAPDLRYTVDSVIGQGEMLAIRLTVTGTMTGRSGNNAPSGKSFVLKMALFNKYVDGKCVEATNYYDAASVYKQMGISSPNA